MPPLVARAAQITLLTPSLEQLGAEVTAPASFAQPDQVEPLNSLTISPLEKPRAAQTTFPLGSGAHDGSEFTVVLPIDVNGPHAARDGCVARPTNNRQQQKMRTTFMTIFSRQKLCSLQYCGIRRLGARKFDIYFLLVTGMQRSGNGLHTVDTRYGPLGGHTPSLTSLRHKQ